jgi:protein tyrosine phosphatase (PTP) superfamily phosphohydrolase (DUF442 family)
MSLDEIYNARVVDDCLLTSGQPSEEQLREVAAAGIDTVINLAPHDSRNALPDEQGLVTELNMTYRYLPVVWDEPTEQDFAAFEQLMLELPADSRTLLHCAANFRVSAFYGLYAMKQLGWSAEQAEAFRAPIWDGSDYAVVRSRVAGHGS